jgi:urease accessory protein
MTILMTILMGTGMTTRTGMATMITTTEPPLTPGQFQRLATWFSPSFPIGGFSYSHGLEAAFEAGLVSGRAGLAGWIEGLMAFGSARNDAILFRETYRLAPDVDPIAEIAAALSPSAELRAETLNQGEAFLRAVRQGWPEFAGVAAEGPGSVPNSATPFALPVAAGLCCALAGMPLRASLLAYLHAFAANIVSAALRSMPVGQSDGLAVQAMLEPAIAQLAEQALDLDLDDLGAATPMLDWLSATHETQYSRLFRS